MWPMWKGHLIPKGLQCTGWETLVLECETKGFSVVVLSIGNGIWFPGTCGRKPRCGSLFSFIFLYGRMRSHLPPLAFSHLEHTILFGRVWGPAVTVSSSDLLADPSLRQPWCVFHAFRTDFSVKGCGVCELGTLLKQRPPSSHHNVTPPLLKMEHFRWLSQKQPTLSMNFGLRISSRLARCWTDILAGESMNRTAVIRSWI